MHIVIGGNRRNGGLPDIHRIVECRARTEHMDKRETVMLHTLLDQCRQILWLGGKTPGHKTDIQ